MQYTASETPQPLLLQVVPDSTIPVMAVDLYVA